MGWNDQPDKVFFLIASNHPDGMGFPTVSMIVFKFSDKEIIIFVDHSFAPQPFSTSKGDWGH